jgi:hypothetical protein
MLHFLVKTFVGGVEETYEKRTLYLCVDYQIFCSEYKFVK